MREPQWLGGRVFENKQKTKISLVHTPAVASSKNTLAYYVGTLVGIYIGKIFETVLRINHDSFGYLCQHNFNRNKKCCVLW
jgi:hypothetical protein